MNAHSLTRWALLLAAASGCGSSVTFDGDEAGTPPGEQPDPPPPDTASLCSASSLNAAAPLLVFANAAGATLVRADGSRQQLDIGADLVPAEATTTTAVAQAKGDHLAVALSYTITAPNLSNGSVVTMFDRSGTRLFQHIGQSYKSSIMDMTFAGEVLISRYHYPSATSDYMLLGNTGSVTEIDNFSPSAFTSDGLLRGA